MAHTLVCLDYDTCEQMLFAPAHNVTTAGAQESLSIQRLTKYKAYFLLLDRKSFLSSPFYFLRSKQVWLESFIRALTANGFWKSLSLPLFPPTPASPRVLPVLSLKYLLNLTSLFTSLGPALSLSHPPLSSLVNSGISNLFFLFLVTSSVCSAPWHFSCLQHSALTP